jgi:hypothetical protein
MDEKDFMIEVIGKSKRIFSKMSWESKEAWAPIQDGSWKWITVLATVCADGEALPPGLIYQAKRGNVQSTWVDSIKAGKYNVFVTSSPSGWTNNNIGLAWLEQVFDRHTKKKARSSYRLLILDGHGSHVTMDFIKYCNKNRILLAAFSPHSIHSLQPLDVVCFVPLAGSYTKKLITNTQYSQGLLPLEKGDFFLLFWHAWTSTFTEKLILKSVESTGIWPMEKDVILKRFCSRTPDEADQPKSSPVLADKDWRRMRTLVEHIVRKGEEESAKKITLSLYHLQVQNDFLLHENKDLHTALTTKRSTRRRARPLTFNSVKSFMVGLFSGVLGRSMRLVSMRG